MKLLTLILELLKQLTEAFNRSERERHEREHKSNVEQAEKDPAVFLDDHFNGDSGLRVDDLPDYAASADKAKAGKSE